MALRSIGIRGYIGELLVEYWLKEVVYANTEDIEIISQVRPAEINPKGGPYIDIGVAQKGLMVSVYEVKTQDYALDKNFKINKALWHLWENPDECNTIICQNRNVYPKHEYFKAYLVLLVPPNQDGRIKLREYYKNLVFFSKIISNINTDNFREHLIKNLIKDGQGDFLELMRICDVHADTME